MFDQNFQVVPVKTSDSKLVSDFITSAPYYFRHLDWHTPTDWVGSSPNYFCTYQAKPIAVLICPFQPEDAIWLRCFAASAFHSMKPAWIYLLAKVKDDLTARGAKSIYTICLTEWYEDLLRSATFQKVNEVIVLEKDLGNVQPIDLPNGFDLTLRRLTEADIPQVWQLDLECFSPLWQMSLQDLTTAFRVSQNCTVIQTSTGEIVGYQISNYLPTGGHLARIAIHPGHQRNGLSKVLLADLLLRFLESGVSRITVNTQADNITAIGLYKSFGFSIMDESYPVFRLTL